jgi:hypothetical protein
VLDASTLPMDCIEQCSAHRSVDVAVDHWVKRLNFTVDAAAAQRYLKGVGLEHKAVDAMNDHTLAMHVLWMACCDIAEYDGDNPDGGMFVMES